MEELAKLEEERGTPGYAKMGRIVTNGDTQVIGRHGKGSLTGGSGATGSRKGKQERIASNEMCTFLILNILSLQLIPANVIAYRQQYGGGGVL